MCVGVLIGYEFLVNDGILFVFYFVHACIITVRGISCFCEL